MAINTDINKYKVKSVKMGDAGDFYPGNEEKKGQDTKYTGEKYIRQRTFVYVDIEGVGKKTISEIIASVDKNIKKAMGKKDKYDAASQLNKKANLLVTRGYGSDHVSAYSIYSKLLKGYSKLLKDKSKVKSVEKLKVPAGIAYVGIAEIVLAQANDNDYPVTVKSSKLTKEDAIKKAITDAIEDCKKGRGIMESVPGTEKDYYSIAKSYIIEGKLKALLTKVNKDTGEIEPVYSDDHIIGLYKKAIVKWSDIENDINNNEYITNPKYALVTLNKEKLVEKAKKGMDYLATWSKIEQAKLITLKAKVPHGKENEFADKLEEAYELCVQGLNGLSSINKEEDYINYDGILTLANIMAKYGRLASDDDVLKYAMETYKILGEKCEFGDIQSLGIANGYALEIELGIFNWDSVDKILTKYLDPVTAGKNNIELDFNPISYSRLVVMLMEAQYRNHAKRETVSVPGCDTCKLSGKVKDYELAEARTQYIIDNVDKIIGVRDEHALTELKVRAMLEKAKAIAASAADKLDSNARIKIYKKSIAVLEKAFIELNPGTKKENIEQKIQKLADNKGIDSMDVAFYVALLADWASYLEQIAWEKNRGLKEDPASFKAAADRYDQAKALCGYSRSNYDKNLRKILISVQIADNATGSLKLGAVESSKETVEKNLKILNDHIKYLESIKVPTDISKERAGKFQANIDRIKFQAMCKQFFYINKQKEENIAGLTVNGDKDGIKIKNKREAIITFRKAIKGLAGQILPLNKDKTSPLDDTYYAVMNMLGVDAVYMGINKAVAAKDAINYYNKYIKKAKKPLTYDMVDVLANAAVILKGDEKYEKMGITEAVIAYLDKKINKSSDSSVKLKCHAWRARLRNWNYIEGTSKSDVLKKAEADYTEAINLYAKIGADDRESLFENAPSKIALMEERALTRFMYVNAEYKGIANASKRINGVMVKKVKDEGYKDIVDDIINNILKKIDKKDKKDKNTTDTSGVKDKLIIKNIKDQDNAAKIKAKLTLASIAVSMSEPLEKKKISVKTVNTICSKMDSGVTVTKEADLFEVSAKVYEKLVGTKEAKGEIEKLGLTKQEIKDLGIDPGVVYGRMADSYMIVALKDATKQAKVIAMINNGIKDKNIDRQSRGSLRMRKGDLLFWLYKKDKEAVEEYEKGILDITGKKEMEGVVKSGYTGLTPVDLLRYADAKAIRAIKSKEGVNTAKGLINKVIGQSGERSMNRAKMYMRKADLINATTKDDTDMNAANKVLKESREYLFRALDIINGKVKDNKLIKVSRDVKAFIDSMASAKDKDNIYYKDKDKGRILMEIMGMIIESHIRIFNTEIKKVSDKKTRWNKEYAAINKARDVVKDYMEKVIEEWPAGESVEKIYSVINLKLKDKDEALRTQLIKVPVWRAGLCKSAEDLKIGINMDLDKLGIKYDPNEVPKKEE